MNRIALSGSWHPGHRSPARGVLPGTAAQPASRGLHRALQRKRSLRMARPPGHLQSARRGAALQGRTGRQTSPVELRTRPALERRHRQGRDRLRRQERSPRHRQGLRRLRTLRRLAHGQPQRRLRNLPAQLSASADLGRGQSARSEKRRAPRLRRACGTTTPITPANGRWSKPISQSASGTRSASR